jgi:ligand-binding SRPBCC domain-containing protein
MANSPQTVRVSSALRAAPESVWRHAASLRGINQELWPLHMSGPAGATLSSKQPLGKPLFRSVISLLRVVVLDLHEVKLLQVDDGHSFHESSRSLMERRWEHVRTVSAQPGGCVVSDEIDFEPRIQPALVASVVRWVFERRHAFLRRKFGELISRT